MPGTRQDPCPFDLAVFRPPYQQLEPIEPGWMPGRLPPRGHALVWMLTNAERQARQHEWIRNRPPGLPLVIALPPASVIQDTIPLLFELDVIQPRAVLPHGGGAAPERLLEILRRPPANLPRTVSDHLVDRGLLRERQLVREVERIFELAPETPSITRLCRQLYTSRRTLGRHFSRAGLPVPSHWLQFARLLHVALRLQRERTAVFRMALRAGYPDGFTFSNQMKRLVDCRPSEIRDLPGWEWLVEAWIAQETRNGGIDVKRHAASVHMYLDAAADPKPRRYPDARNNTDRLWCAEPDEEGYDTGE